MLDDYHLIQDKRVHVLLAKILLHLPQTLHLVLASRVDPPLALAKLRARSQMMEIRAQDLRFNDKETAVLFGKLLGTPIDQDTASSLEERSEGWVTGLKLAVLSREHLGNRDPILNDIQVNNRFLTDYLMSSVYSLQRPDVQQWLIQTAILDHEYSIGEGRDKVAKISKKWFRIRDSYGVEIEPDQDTIIILTVTVCIDQMAH